MLIKCFLFKLLLALLVLTDIITSLGKFTCVLFNHGSSTFDCLPWRTMQFERNVFLVPFALRSMRVVHTSKRRHDFIIKWLTNASRSRIRWTSPHAMGLFFIVIRSIIYNWRVPNIWSRSKAIMTFWEMILSPMRSITLRKQFNYRHKPFTLSCESVRTTRLLIELLQCLFCRWFWKDSNSFPPSWRLSRWSLFPDGSLAFDVGRQGETQPFG